MEFTIEKFFFDIPIYTPIKIDDKEWDEFVKLNGNEIVFEGYNPLKKIESTFWISRSIRYSNLEFYENGGFVEVRIKCKRYGDEFRYYILWSPKEKILIKLGQFPSVADFHIHEIKHYNKLLSNAKLKEFTKAIGLAANGVGIGSFVYLRRIFEYLIQEAYQTAFNAGCINKVDYEKSRMDQKIELLKNYLPDFLVTNKSMYSILSLGIHELDEQTCLENFDTLRVGIEIILDEKLEILRKSQKIEEAQKKLQSLKSNIQK